MQSGVELNRANHGYRAAGLEVASDGSHEVLDVDLDVDEDVKGLDLGHTDRYKTAVGVVDQYIAAKSTRSIVVDAASAVGDIAHDNGLCTGTELCQDIRDGRSKEEQAFGHLQGNLLSTRCAYSMDRLVDLEIVVLRK